MSQPPVVRMLCATPWPQRGSAVEALLHLRPLLVQRALATGARSALLSAQGWLVQWHEGAATDIAAQREVVRAGLGLEPPRLVHGSHGPGSLPEPVQLAALQIAGQGDMARRLQFLQRQHEQGWDAEPVDVWQALCAPCQLEPAWKASLVGPREVVALISEDNDAEELLRGFAARVHARVTYQRYAGSDLQRRDVGAAYLDMEVGAPAVTRVQALSLRALGCGIDLLGLRQVHRLVLLLGPHSLQQPALLREAARLVERLPVPPAVHLMCSCPATRAGAAQELLATPGLAVYPLEAPCSGLEAVRALGDLIAPAWPAPAAVPHRRVG